MVPLFFALRRTAIPITLSREKAFRLKGQAIADTVQLPQTEAKTAVFRDSRRLISSVTEVSLGARMKRIVRIGTGWPIARIHAAGKIWRRKIHSKSNVTPCRFTFPLTQTETLIAREKVMAQDGGLAWITVKASRTGGGCRAWMLPFRVSTTKKENSMRQRSPLPTFTRSRTLRTRYVSVL
jgi:hypothetical protein